MKVCEKKKKENHMVYSPPAFSRLESTLGSGRRHVPLLAALPGPLTGTAALLSIAHPPNLPTPCALEISPALNMCRLSRETVARSGSHPRGTLQRLRRTAPHRPRLPGRPRSGALASRAGTHRSALWHHNAGGCCCLWQRGTGVGKAWSAFVPL